MKLFQLLFGLLLLSVEQYGWATSPRIDIFIAYTPQALAYLGDANSAFQLAIGQMNQSFVNSGVNLNVSLADTMSVSDEYSSSSQALNGLLANSAAKVRRDNANADVVVLVAHFGDACGLADAISATAQTAFVVVADSCLNSNLSMAHEIGHLLGGRHDPQNDSTPGSNHGYWMDQDGDVSADHNVADDEIENPNNCWHTIMSYAAPSLAGCTSDIRINYWSNSSVRYNGFPTGANCCNNATVVNQTGPSVAQFSNTKLGVSVLDAILNIISMIFNDAQ